MPLPRPPPPSCHVRVELTAALLDSTGLTEEQIQDIFGTCGTVLNFRLVYDRETGRPKGFGFAEYPDAGASK